MTYCLGWRTGIGVFVAADTAFSAASPDAHHSPDIARTSFGELQGDAGKGEGRYVVEEGVKISVGQDYVTAFAGDVDVARRYVDCFEIARSAAFSIREAARSAMLSCGGQGSNTTVLIGAYEADQPVLLRVDLVDSRISDHEDLVQVGSVPEQQARWTQQMLAARGERLPFRAVDPAEAAPVFTPVLALLQSYGVHDYLLPDGIGGAFIGAWVTARGARWQTDNLFVVHGADMGSAGLTMCGVMVRQDVVTLIGNRAEVIKVLGRPVPGRQPSASDLAEQAISQYDDAVFDYFVSINLERHVVTTIEMQRSRHHPYVALWPAGGGTIGIMWTEKLLGIVDTIAGVPEPQGDEMTLYFFPHMPVPPELQEEIDAVASEREFERLFPQA
jgi:hypothetical protein